MKHIRALLACAKIAGEASTTRTGWVGWFGELGLRERNKERKKGATRRNFFAGFRCDGQATAGSSIRYLAKERRERRDKVVDEGQGEFQPREFHAFPGEFVTLFSWNCGYNYRQSSLPVSFSTTHAREFPLASPRVSISEASHERRSFS